MPTFDISFFLNIINGGKQNIVQKPHFKVSTCLEKKAFFLLTCMKKGQAGFDFGLSDYFSLSHFLENTLYLLKICSFSLRVYIIKYEKRLYV